MKPYRVTVIEPDYLRAEEGKDACVKKDAIVNLDEIKFATQLDSWHIEIVLSEGLGLICEATLDSLMRACEGERSA